MNYWNRALCSVSRRKGKSIILFSVIFILGNVIAGSIAIQQSTNNVEKKIKHQLGATVSVDLDYEKMMDESSDGQLSVPSGLKIEDIKKMGQSPYVKEFDYSISSAIQMKKVKAYEAEQEESASISMTIPNYLSLKGSNLSEPLDFKEKKIKLVDGRTFTQTEIDKGTAVAIISKKVAEANGVNVGDQLVLDSVTSDYKQDGSSEELYTLDHPVKIIGIFEPVTLEKKEADHKNSNDVNQQMVKTEQFNTAYLPNGAVSAINKVEHEKGKIAFPDKYKNSDGMEMTEEELNPVAPSFILKSPEDVEAFKEETKAMVPEFYKLNASTDEYDQVGATFKKMSQISGYVVFLAIGAALLIISLVVVLFLRDRKHELGIYLSLGETRGKVMQQIIIELLFISLIAMCLSLLTGNVLGKIVSDSLIASETLSQADSVNANNLMTLGSETSVSNLTMEDVSNAYEVKFSLSYIAAFMIAGISTVLLSAILPLTYVLRLNPKNIMM